MIDVILGVWDLFSPLGGTGYNVLTEKTEKWKNSKYDIVFGDSTSFTLGLGRQTIVFGPDIKTILDWSVLLDLAGEKIKNKSWNFLWNGLMGQGGSTDFILGNKNIFNYGTRDFSITRKGEATVKVELIKQKDDDQLPGTGFNNKLRWQRSLVIIYCLFQMTLGISIRILYMGAGIDVQNAGEKEERKKTVELLMMIQSTVGVRILAVLGAVETLYFANTEIVKRKEEAKKQLNGAGENLQQNAGLLQDKIANPNPVEAVGQAYRDYLSVQLVNERQQISAEIQQTAQRTLGDLGIALNGAGDGEQRQIGNAPIRWDIKGQFTWNSGTRITNNVNSLIYGDDKSEESNTIFDQSTKGFLLELNYPKSINARLPAQLQQYEYKKAEFNLDKNGFRIWNQISGTAISLSNGSTNDISRTALDLINGKITLGCGKRDGAAPSVNMDAQNQYLTLSQGGIPKKGYNSLEVLGRALFLDQTLAGLYGGKRTDNDKTAGYIELNGQNSLVIKLLGSEVRLDANGVTIKSNKKITLEGDGGIELKSGQSKLSVQDSGVQIESVESVFNVKPDGLTTSAVIRKNNEEAALKEKNSIQNIDCSGISISKAPAIQIN